MEALLWRWDRMWIGWLPAAGIGTTDPRLGPAAIQWANCTRWYAEHNARLGWLLVVAVWIVGGGVVSSAIDSGAWVAASIRLVAWASLFVTGIVWLRRQSQVADHAWASESASAALALPPLAPG